MARSPDSDIDARANDPQIGLFGLIIRTVSVISALCITLGGIAMWRNANSFSVLKVWGFQITSNSIGVILTALGVWLLYICVKHVMKRIPVAPLREISGQKTGLVIEAIREDSTKVAPSTSAIGALTEIHEDVDHRIKSRRIECHYASKTHGMIRHSIELEATHDRVAQYQGRILCRDEDDLSVESPHELHKGERQMGFQMYRVLFPYPLMKGQTTKIVLTNHWRQKDQERYPELPFFTLSPTDRVDVEIEFAEGLRILNPRLQLKTESTVMEVVRDEILPIRKKSIEWSRNDIKPRMIYRTTWEWQ